MICGSQLFHCIWTCPAVQSGKSIKKVSLFGWSLCFSQVGCLSDLCIFPTSSFHWNASKWNPLFMWSQREEFLCSHCLRNALWFVDASKEPSLGGFSPLVSHSLCPSLANPCCDAPLTRKMVEGTTGDKTTVLILRTPDICDKRIMKEKHY